MTHDKEQNAVRNVLQALQNGYTARDVGQLDQLMADLWAKDEGQFIIGTGHGEWSFGPAEVRRLIELDWLHWGNMRLDVENAPIVVSGDVAWLSATGTVSKQGNAEQDNEQLLAITKDDLKSDLPGYRKLLFLSAGIAQPLWEFSRGSEFIWPLRFTASLVKQDGRWLFHHMHFSFDSSDYPDNRLGVAKVEPWDVDAVQTKLIEKVQQHGTNAHDSIRSLLNKLSATFTAKDATELRALLAEQSLFVGTAPGQRAIGREEAVAAILAQAEHDRFWGELRLHSQDALVSMQGDTVWIGCTGTVTRKTSPEEVYQAHFDRIQQLVDSNLSVQSKLLGIIRHNSFTLMELEKGELNVWPVRLSAVAVRVDGAWRFSQLHFSYPTVWGSDERILPDQQ